VVAPSRSLTILSQENRSAAIRRLEKLGFGVTFGAHVDERDEFDSSSIDARVEDLHQAFRDPKVKAILTVIGGFNSNQLLHHLDYDLIRSNPKILCGYSDITALQNAIYARCDLATYSGPHFSTFAMKRGLEYTVDFFWKCLVGNTPYELTPSERWSDDPWWENQEQRVFEANPGLSVIQPGSAAGKIVGGNLCTLNLLQGTEYMPSLKESVLFLEEDELPGALSDVEFDRNLQSLLHLPGFSGVKGIVIGRFQRRSMMTPEKLKTLVMRKKELRGIPVVYGADFGHTAPMVTFPIGGKAQIESVPGRVKLTILTH
jgi:muramoyltetrapeptide carboxypeptidase LdcA involved in peptidoglycan recycling